MYVEVAVRSHCSSKTRFLYEIKWELLLSSTDSSALTGSIKHTMYTERCWDQIDIKLPSAFILARGRTSDQCHWRKDKLGTTYNMTSWWPHLCTIRPNFTSILKIICTFIFRTDCVTIFLNVVAKGGTVRWNWHITPDLCLATSWLHDSFLQEGDLQISVFEEG
jgi:hypothetical protein